MNFTNISADCPAFSVGYGNYDVYPYNHSLDALFTVLNEDRSPTKGGKWITSPMRSPAPRKRGKRCKANALPKPWFGLDNDGNLSNTHYEQCITRFEIFKGWIYTTASDQDNARRFRALIQCSRPINEAECKILSQLIERYSGLGGWDQSVYRCPQPLYTPTQGAELIELHGDLLDVDLWLSKAPQKPKPIRKKINRIYPSTNVFGAFANNNMVIKTGSDRHEVICPWAHLHTDGRLEAMLFEPSAENNLAWGFKCLHSHCVDKTIRDVYRWMGEK